MTGVTSMKESDGFEMPLSCGLMIYYNNYRIQTENAGIKSLMEMNNHLLNSLYIFDTYLYYLLLYYRLPLF